jgi:hypothetical protein
MIVCVFVAFSAVRSFRAPLAGLVESSTKPLLIPEGPQGAALFVPTTYVAFFSPAPGGLGVVAVLSKAVPPHAMEALGGEEYSSYSFLTSSDGVIGQRHSTATLYPREKDLR